MSGLGDTAQSQSKVESDGADALQLFSFQTKIGTID